VTIISQKKMIKIFESSDEFKVHPMMIGINPAKGSSYTRYTLFRGDRITPFSCYVAASRVKDFKKKIGR
jgi:hypothetical protein